MPTYGTVVPFCVFRIFLPPIQADFVPISITSIMTKLVIPRSAQGVAIVSIIMS